MRIPQGRLQQQGARISAISYQQMDRLMATLGTPSLATAVWVCWTLRSSSPLQQWHQVGTGTEPNTSFCRFGALNESTGLLMTLKLSKIRT